MEVHRWCEYIIYCDIMEIVSWSGSVKIWVLKAFVWSYWGKFNGWMKAFRSDVKKSFKYFSDSLNMEFWICFIKSCSDGY